MTRIASFFPLRTTRRTSSSLWAFYPDRPPFRLYLAHGAWWWKQGAGSFPQSAAIENVRAEGGRVERRHADWRPDGPTHRP